MTDWQPLTKNDSYLVAASDGVFEKLSLQDVCDLLWEGRGKCVCSSCSLADCIVNTAFEKGSMDNMAAIVVPMVPTIFSENLEKERLVVDGDLLIPVLGPKASIGRLSGSFLFTFFWMNGISLSFEEKTFIHVILASILF